MTLLCITAVVSTGECITLVHIC